MKLSSFLTGVYLLGVTSAVDMSQYSPGEGVEAAFKPYLQELYRQTELLNATDSFTDFFVTDGRFTILGNSSVGAKRIIELKQFVLPPSSGQLWNHRPNRTTILSQNATQKVYQVFGIIEKNFNGFMGVNNCSEQFYQSNFTVQKLKSGATNLVTHGQNLIDYNDYGVQPQKAPTNIKCGSP